MSILKKMSKKEKKKLVQGVLDHEEKYFSILKNEKPKKKKTKKD